MRIDIRVTPEIKEEWQKRASSKGITLTELILTTMNGVHTDIVHTEDVATDVHTKVELVELEPVGVVSLDKLQGELEEAIEMSDGENWNRVKELVRVSGYEWDGATRCLSQNGRVVWRGYGK